MTFLRIVRDVLPEPPLAESPASHCRNALQLVRFAFECGLPLFDNEPAIAVRVADLDAIQRRLEAAISLLEEQSATIGRKP